MKIKIVANETRPPKKPEVGTLWRHTPAGPASCVRMRIEDTGGRRALGYDTPPETMFFSVNMETGRIEYTDVSTPSGAMWEALEPVGGVLELKVKENA